MVYRHTSVKNETVAGPPCLRHIDLFKVFENATFEMQTFEARLQEVSRCLFTSYTAGAKHGDSIKALEVLSILFNPLWELGERLSLRIERAFEGANVVFVVISRVDDTDVRVIDNLIPITRFDVFTDADPRIDIIDA